MTRWMGLDCHPASITAYILDDNQPKGRHLTFANTPEEWAAFDQDWVTSTTHCVLEASGGTWPLYDGLQAAGAAEVLVAHPLQVKAIAAARVKTDKADAKTLAELGRADLIPTVYVPTRQERDLRALVARHVALTKEATAQKNQLHAALRRQAVPYSHRRLDTLEGRAFLTQVCGELPAPEALIVQGCLAIADRLEAECQAVHAVLARTVQDGDPAFREAVEVLMSQTGVGLLTAVALRARLGDIRRFPTARHVVSYLGLAPRVRNSGGTVRLGRIAKQGDGTCRFLLVQAAWAAVRGPGPLQDQFVRLRARKGSKIAITATARRLLVVLVALLRTGRLHHQVNPTRLAIKRKAATTQALPYEAALERAFERLARRAERVRRLSDAARTRHPA